LRLIYAPNAPILHQFSTRKQAKIGIERVETFQGQYPLFEGAVLSFIEKQTSRNWSANLLFIPLCDVAESLFHLFFHTFRSDDSHCLSQTEDPCKKLLAHRDADADSEMSVVLFHGHDVTDVPFSASLWRCTLICVCSSPFNYFNTLILFISPMDKHSHLC